MKQSRGVPLSDDESLADDEALNLSLATGFFTIFPISVFSG